MCRSSISFQTVNLIEIAKDSNDFVSEQKIGTYKYPIENLINFNQSLQKQIKKRERMAWHGNDMNGVSK